MVAESCTLPVAHSQSVPLLCFTLKLFGVPSFLFVFSETRLRAWSKNVYCPSFLHIVFCLFNFSVGFNVHVRAFLVPGDLLLFFSSSSCYFPKSGFLSLSDPFATPIPTPHLFPQIYFSFFFFKIETEEL